MARSLLGKTVVVTGASRGIGKAIALALGKEGAQVLVHYGRHAREADQVVAEIRSMGSRSEKINADLAQPDGPHKLAKRAKEIIGGRLDILVANAGVFLPSSIDDLAVEEFDKLFAVNVRAPLFLVQQLRPIMCTGSNVIFVSSLAARATIGDFAAYAASKGALETTVKYLARAFGPHGIRVNAVAPGVIETDAAAFVKTGEGREHTLAMQTFKRIGSPEDVARVVAFLASNQARWITGEVVPVDGGSQL
ncbi:SDR family oxidoreductase [Rhizobium calliandrae]|uniref:Glucose 1-dehydrogenase n=2 Tax=Rhizobium TaxID=379 RepID=A0A387FWR6_9HYPH|nr:MULTISPECIES: glucose 1-dehydrogenase [Rhizobium]AYG59972.1 glucose 1-dehydrogenase [Rhizobium jaguaris]MDL2406941.1 SDR family oxidoreductase [Rhizobium calliandrae]